LALILNIDTATEVASVCISRDGNILSLLTNNQQKEHASFIHVAIQNAANEANIRLQDLEAVAVTNGPGSYTGLRVGLATAKGLCYALKLPLITASTLRVMASAALHHKIEEGALLCPMIDARRMEVFTAVYDQSLHELMKEQPLVVDATNFDIYLTNKKVLFFGSGSTKIQAVIMHKNALFNAIEFNASHLVSLAEQAFTKAAFEDVAYAEPRYLKEFYTP
jgi:tRNA threonylcarbamoyladenosine biosynthesis protein TsaB